MCWAVFFSPPPPSNDTAYSLQLWTGRKFQVARLIALSLVSRAGLAGLIIYSHSAQFGVVGYRTQLPPGTDTSALPEC